MLEESEMLYRKSLSENNNEIEESFGFRLARSVGGDCAS